MIKHDDINIMAEIPNKPRVPEKLKYDDPLFLKYKIGGKSDVFVVFVAYKPMQHGDRLVPENIEFRDKGSFKNENPVEDCKLMVEKILVKNYQAIIVVDKEHFHYFDNLFPTKKEFLPRLEDSEYPLED